MTWGKWSLESPPPKGPSNVPTEAAAALGSWASWGAGPGCRETAGSEEGELSIASVK